MNITLKQLKTLQTVVEHHSYTEAAKALFMTQPAVSMQIKQMEEQIEMPLFEREGKQVTLTEAGHELLHYARNIRQQLDEASEMLEELKGFKGRILKTSLTKDKEEELRQVLAGI